MRISILAVALAACMSGQAAFAALAVTEVASTSGAPAGALSGLDWWELTNTGPGSVLLDGYQWKDSDGNLPGMTDPDTAIFPNGITIGAGESIIIHDGDSSVVAAFRADWGLSPLVQILHEEMNFTGNNPFSGLSSGGDQVNLYDNLNNLVAGVSFGASTAGKSFEWDTAGDSLGLSVVGEFGAYAASNNRVGSPGVGVPEPAAMALVLTAACGMLCSRSRRRS